MINMLTTVIGSYPLSYEKLGKAAILQSVEDQLKAGIDLVSDGQTRSDMIQSFASLIEGYTFDSKSYITGKIGRASPDPLLDDLRTALELTSRVKGILTGPVTLVLSSRIKGFYEGYRDEKVYLDTAKALCDIALAMEEQGVEWIQIDEPYLSVGAPMEIAKKALESIALNLKVPVALHVCGKVGPILDRLLDLRGISLLSHGFMGEDNRELLHYRGLINSVKKLGLGCINTKRNRVETVEEIGDLIKMALSNMPAERLVIHPDCGLRSLDRESAFAKLTNMVSAVRSAR